MAMAGHFRRGRDRVAGAVPRCHAAGTQPAIQSAQSAQACLGQPSLGLAHGPLTVELPNRVRGPRGVTRRGHHVGHFMCDSNFRDAGKKTLFGGAVVCSSLWHHAAQQQNPRARHDGDDSERSRRCCFFGSRRLVRHGGLCVYGRARPSAACQKVANRHDDRSAGIQAGREGPWHCHGSPWAPRGTARLVPNATPRPATPRAGPSGTHGPCGPWPVSAGPAGLGQAEPWRSRSHSMARPGRRMRNLAEQTTALFGRGVTQ